MYLQKLVLTIDLIHIYNPGHATDIMRKNVCQHMSIKLESEAKHQSPTPRKKSALEMSAQT